jgi:hypothetical protein
MKLTVIFSRFSYSYLLTGGENDVGLLSVSL